MGRLSPVVHAAHHDNGPASGTNTFADATEGAQPTTPRSSTYCASNSYANSKGGAVAGKDRTGTSSKGGASYKGSLCARVRQASTSRSTAYCPPHPIAAGRRTTSKGGRQGTHRNTDAVMNATRWPQSNLRPLLRIPSCDSSGNDHAPGHQAAQMGGATTAYAVGATTAYAVGAATATSFTSHANRDPSASSKPPVSHGPTPPSRLPHDRQRNGKGS